MPLEGIIKKRKAVRNQMSKWKKFGDYVTVDLPDPEWDRHFGTQTVTKINWSAIGAVGIPQAEQFMRDLFDAIQFAKEADAATETEHNQRPG